MNSYQHTNLQQKTYGRERGAILVTALIMLTVLTLLGLASMRNSVMEERMAANDVFRNRAFQAADATGEIALTAMVTATGSMSGTSFADALDKFPVPLTVTLDPPPDFTGYDNGPEITHVTTLTYMRTEQAQTATESSIGIDRAVASYMVYELAVEAQVSGTGARSTVVKGISVPGAGG